MPTPALSNLGLVPGQALQAGGLGSKVVQNRAWAQSAEPAPVHEESLLATKNAENPQAEKYDRRNRRGRNWARKAMQRRKQSPLE
jgi:hypothetical protein